MLSTPSLSRDGPEHPRWAYVALCQAAERRGAPQGRRGSSVVLGGSEGEDAKEPAGEVALERAQRLAQRLAGGHASRDVVAGRLVDADLGDGDDVQRAVQPAVAGAVETVALLAPG